MRGKHEISQELVDRGFLTDGQVCKILNVAENTMRLWRHQGRGPCFYKFGRNVYYRRDDVEAWITQQVVTPTPKAA